MLEELDRLITFIQQKYYLLLNEWNNINSCEPINLKKTQVRKINNNINILNTILNYRLFINTNNLDLKMDFNELKLENEINTRVKTQNSIEFKIDNYMKEKHKYGKVPINKCFNDIYGIRIIFAQNIDHKVIKKFIEDKYNKKEIKCIDASKIVGYVATHVYFKENNFSFPWELQIWDKAHEKSNIELHKQYKQEYTKWEKENKGGESF